MSSSVVIDNKNKGISILVKGPTASLDDTTLEKEYYLNFAEKQNKFYLILHDNGADSRIFVKGLEIY